MAGSTKTTKPVVRSSSNSKHRKPYQITLFVEYDGTGTSLAGELENLIDDPYGYNDGNFGRYHFTVKSVKSDELENALA